MRDGSGQRQRRFWRAVENSGIAAGKRRRLDGKYGFAGKANPSEPGNLRERSGERVQRAALIMQAECSMVVVGVGMGERGMDVRVVVCRHGRRLIYIQRVVVEQWNDTCHLRDHEDRQQERANPPDCSHKRHGMGHCYAGPILGQTGDSAAADVPQCRIMSRSHH